MVSEKYLNNTKKQTKKVVKIEYPEYPSQLRRTTKTSDLVTNCKARHLVFSAFKSFSFYVIIARNTFTGRNFGARWGGGGTVHIDIF